MAKTTFSIAKDYFTISETGIIDYLFDQDLINKFENSEDKKELKLEYDTDTSSFYHFDYSEVTPLCNYVGDNLNKSNLKFVREYIKFLNYYNNGDLEELGNILYNNYILKAHENLIIYKLRPTLKAIFSYSFIIDTKLDFDLLEEFLTDIELGYVSENDKLGKLYLLSKDDMDDDWLTSFDDLKNAYLDYFLTHRTLIPMVGSYYHKEELAKLKEYFNKVEQVKITSFLTTGKKIDQKEALNSIVKSYCIREKDNPFDKNAIAVKFSTFDEKVFTLGYLPKEIAAIFKNVKIDKQFNIAFVNHYEVKIACNF